MHECPECGEACSCDCEDTWHESGDAVDECVHQCPPESDEDQPEDFHEPDCPCHNCQFDWESVELPPIARHDEDCPCADCETWRKAEALRDTGES